MAAVCCLAACDKAGFSYDNVTDGGHVQYTLLDTLEIQMRTVQPDSVATSGTGAAFAGGYADAFFGSINTGSYFRVALPAERNIEDKAVYDSIELVMRPNGFSYGDTLPLQTLQVHQLLQPLVLPENYTAFFSHQQLPFNNTPLATHQLAIRPTSGELLHLRLSDAKGTELFTLLKSKANEVSSEDFFREYFKGLYIKGLHNTAIFGFTAADSALYIRLHYHVVTHEKEEKYLDFLMTTPELQFNAVRADRGNTPLAELSPGNGLPSTASNNRAYLQPLTGALIRMDFPSLTSLQELGKYGRIMRAELVLRPVSGTYVREALPQRLVLGLADFRHQVSAGDTIISAGGGAQYGNLQADKLHPENTRYVYDVTDYCQAMITADSYAYRGLLLMPPGGEYRTQFNRLVLGDGKNTQHRAELKIYYLIYQ
jgi:hypothetical protein